MEESWNMQHQVNDISTFIKDREIEYLLNPVKVLIKQNLPKIVIGSISLNETNEDDIIDIPRWAAEVFSELGFGEVQEESFEIDMLKALSRERIQGSNQLSTLTGGFYLRLRRHINSLRNSDSNGAKETYDEAHMRALDLVTLRTVKLLPLTVGENIHDIALKITPEELQLFHIIRNIVQKWKISILERTTDE